MLRGSLQKMFGPLDTLFLGVGIVIGSGWGQVGMAQPPGLDLEGMVSVQQCG